jgi:hypothetical protein
MTRLRFALRCAAASGALALAGCTQVYPTLQEQRISLAPGSLEKAGVAFITPSTVTGQEQEKQAVALVFAETLKRERPDVRVMSLADTLSAVNRAGLAEAYRKMYDDSRETGLFAREDLRRMGEATRMRYLVHLKLLTFGQGSKERWGALGIRILETKYAHLRLFLQVWDTHDGSIALEAMQEIRYALESVTEEPVMQRDVLERAARDLIARLP